MTKLQTSLYYHNINLNGKYKKIMYNNTPIYGNYIALTTISLNHCTKFWTTWFGLQSSTNWWYLDNTLICQSNMMSCYLEDKLNSINGSK